jgi:hypothetical protein
MSKSIKAKPAEVQFSKKETAAPKVMGETVAITGNGNAKTVMTGNVPENNSSAGAPVLGGSVSQNAWLSNHNLFRYEFKPQPDITVYELAQSMPYIVNAIHSVNKKEECNCKYLRHFEITPF